VRSPLDRATRFDPSNDPRSDPLP